jgi:hypothetical protein
MRRCVPLGALLAAALLLAPAVAEAATCSYNSLTTTMTVTLNANETATVSTSPTSPTVLTLNGVSCTGATVSGTNTVTINGTNTGNETAIVDLSNGPLGPGQPAEAEIKFNAVLMGGLADRLTVTGSTAADDLVIGALGVNFNGDDDADITPSGVENFTASGADGDDVVSAAGGAGTGSALTLPSSLQGDQGNDVLESGQANDTIGVARALTRCASRRQPRASPSRWQ